MAFLRASILRGTSLPSRASLISFASDGAPLSKWTRRVHDFSICFCIVVVLAGEITNRSPELEGNGCSDARSDRI